MTRQELQDQCDALTDLYGLEPHTVTLFRTTRFGGDCMPEWRQIRITIHMEDARQLGCLRHELAHAMAFQRAKCACHCDVFKECLRLLGGDAYALIVRRVAQSRRRVPPKR